MCRVAETAAVGRPAARECGGDREVVVCQLYCLSLLVSLSLSLSNSSPLCLMVSSFC